MKFEILEAWNGGFFPALHLGTFIVGHRGTAEEIEFREEYAYGEVDESAAQDMSRAGARRSDLGLAPALSLLDHQFEVSRFDLLSP